jgi:hypothetical protein
VKEGIDLVSVACVLIGSFSGANLLVCCCLILAVLSQRVEGFSFSTQPGTEGVR